MMARRVPNGGKMAPKWLPGGLWAALGCRLCFQRLPGAILEGPGGPRKFAVGGFGASWGGQLIDFTPPEAPREGPRVALGGHVGSIFPGGSPGTKKVRKINKCSMFFEVDLACDFIIFLGLRRGAGADAQS